MGQEQEDMGAGTGSRASTEPQGVSALTGFDPARVAELYANEELILAALDDAYHNGRLKYVHYSAAWDATCTRMAALSWGLPASAMSARSDETQSGSVRQDASAAREAGDAHNA